MSSAVGRVHRIAVEMDQRFEVVAGCFSRNLSTNQKSAVRYGVAPTRTYVDLDELLDNESGQLAGILILTPTDQHKSQVMRCLAAGVPVICEKALGNFKRGGPELRQCWWNGNDFCSDL